MSPLSKKTQRLIERIEKEKKILIDHKTKLWELVGELQQICETVEDGCAELKDGVDLIIQGMDSMSQYI